MAKINPFFRTGGEGAIATYDKFELSSGVGYKDFYGAMYSSGALVTNEIYSDNIDTSNGFNEVTAIFTTSEFSQPLTLSNGNVYVSVPLGVYTNGNASSCYASCALILEDTEGAQTTLGNGTTSTLSRSTAGTTAFTKATKFEISQTTIKPSEKLILRVELLTSQQPAGTEYAIAHDPANRTPTTENSNDGMNWGTSGSNSQLVLSLPIRIDL